MSYVQLFAGLHQDLLCLVLTVKEEDVKEARSDTLPISLLILVGAWVWCQFHPNVAGFIRDRLWRDCGSLFLQ